jgi:transcription factor WhiB
MLALREWTKDAACAGSDDPDLWFVEGSSDDREALTSPQALQAYPTCVRCPLRRQCLAEALMVAPVLMNPGDDARRTKELFTYGT